MAADNLSPLSLLNYVPLTAAVTQIMTELPKPLPDMFYNQTRQVPGNKFRRFLHRGTRQVSRQAIYGSPPRQVPQISLARQDAVMIHSIEQIGAGEEVLALFHSLDSYNLMPMAKELLDERAKQFAVRSNNLRTAAIHSSVANGKIWFDPDGELLASSSGADLTIDFGIPNGNRVSAAATWATATNDIPTMVLNFLTYAMQNGDGRKPKYAICGKNVPGYLAKNTSFQQYLARTESFRNKYVNEGVVADGVLGLTWIFAQDAYYEKWDGTLVSQFPDDQITFVPELTRDVYELKEGSQPVPKMFLTQNITDMDFNQVISMLFNNPVFGPFRYAYGEALPVPQIWMVQGDNFLPDFPTPRCVWFYDTTP